MARLTDTTVVAAEHNADVLIVKSATQTITRGGLNWNDGALSTKERMRCWWWARGQAGQIHPGDALAPANRFKGSIIVNFRITRIPVIGTSTQYITTIIFGLVRVGKHAIAGESPLWGGNGVAIRNSGVVIQFPVQHWRLPRPAGIILPIVRVVERSHMIPHLMDGIYIRICGNSTVGNYLVAINDFNFFPKPDSNARVGFEKLYCCLLRRTRKQSAHGLLHGRPCKLLYDTVA